MQFFDSHSHYNDEKFDIDREKIYKRFKEKLNLEEIFNQVKTKYDIAYKELKIEKNDRTNKFLIILMLICLLLGVSNIAAWMFIK